MEHKDLETIIQENLAVEAEDAKHAGKIGYMARALVQATLPHKAVKGNIFKRSNGAYELTIMAPDGLPYGSIPRLLLSWMTTEAVRTRSPMLVLGPSMSAFMAELGLGRTGGEKGTITRLKTQTERLFSSSVSCRYRDANTTQGAGFNIAREYSLWWNPKAPEQVPIWQSTVTLSGDFFKEITERPVPVDMLALKSLKRSPMALDIYFWLTYRLSYMQKDTIVPWELLQMQFGADYATEGQGPRDFKRKFLLRLKDVLAVYDTARIAESGQGLLLKPSPPHVPKQPVPEVSGCRRKLLPAAPSAGAISTLFDEDSYIRLQTETYLKAREKAPRLDIYVIEREWREWMARTGKRPKNPDKAFIGFCEKRSREHGLA